MPFSTEIEQNPKVCMESQRPLKVKAILRMKNKAIGIAPPDFKLYYEALAIKIVWYYAGDGMKHQHCRVV